MFHGDLMGVTPGSCGGVNPKANGVSAGGGGHNWNHQRQTPIFAHLGGLPKSATEVHAFQKRTWWRAGCWPIHALLLVSKQGHDKYVYFKAFLKTTC